MAGYVLSNEADQDLVGIYEYTLETWGIEQLEFYSSSIQRALKILVEDPEEIRSIARYDLAEGCRCYRVEKHYIFYRFKNNRIEVARILHQRMDLDNQNVKHTSP